MPDNKVLLDDFFMHLNSAAGHYKLWTNSIPKKLVISPEILKKLSKIEGFYQRPELKSEVTAYSPIVRYFTLKDCVVTIKEDFEEPFLHFE